MINYISLIISLGNYGGYSFNYCTRTYVTKLCLKSSLKSCHEIETLKLPTCFKASKQQYRIETSPPQHYIITMTSDNTVLSPWQHCIITITTLYYHHYSTVLSLITMTKLYCHHDNTV